MSLVVMIAKGVAHLALTVAVMTMQELAALLLVIATAWTAGTSDSMQYSKLTRANIDEAVHLLSLAPNKRMITLATQAPIFLLLAYILVSLKTRSLVFSRNMVMSRSATSCATLTPENLVDSVSSRW